MTMVVVLLTMTMTVRMTSMTVTSMTMTSMMTLLHRSLRPMMWDYRPAGSSFHRDGLVRPRSAVCAGLWNIFQVNAQYWRRYCLSALCCLCWSLNYLSGELTISSVRALQFSLVKEVFFRYVNAEYWRRYCPSALYCLRSYYKYLGKAEYRHIASGWSTSKKS